MTAQQTERKHLQALISIHQRRIALMQQRIDRAYGGARDKLPLDQLIQLEDDERRVAELTRKLDAS